LRHAGQSKAQLAAQIHNNEHVPAPVRWGEVFGDDVVAEFISTLILKKRDLSWVFMSWTGVHVEVFLGRGS
jgi:hypothetical protein